MMSGFLNWFSSIPSVYFGFWFMTILFLIVSANANQLEKENKRLQEEIEELKKSK